MKRLILSALLTAALLAGCEAGVRGLYALARSGPHLAWFLGTARGGIVEFEPADAVFLGTGFYPPVLAPDGASLVWASATESEVVWPIYWRQDLTLVLTIRSFPHAQAEGLPLRVSLNGRPLTEHRLPTTWTSLSVPAPAGAQRLGWNRLRLSVPRLFPAQLLSDRNVDPRLLGFQLDRLEIR